MTTPILQAENVVKTFGQGHALVRAVDGVSLELQQGEMVTITGPSGSGKTTLVSILGALLRADSGRVVIDGTDISTLGEAGLSALRARTIGFVFQAFNLIPQLKIEENVEVPLFYQGIPKAQRRERAIKALGLVGLDDRTGHRPSELSGGQQQRVAIARALVTEPVVLMADEPTGNLDSATGLAILELVEKLHRVDGMTILMVTHDDAIAERCERIVRLRDGLIESDTVHRRTGRLASQ